MSLASSLINRFACCAAGKRILTLKLFSRPALVAGLHDSRPGAGNNHKLFLGQTVRNCLANS